MDRWVDPRLRSVRVADVRKYLLAHDWKSKPYPRPELLVFEGPPDDNGEPIVQVLPSSEDFADYQLGLLELVTALAVIEDRPAVAVLDDILQQGTSADGSDGNGAAPAGPRPRRRPSKK
jgi:hypothetical protein